MVRVNGVRFRDNAGSRPGGGGGKFRIGVCREGSQTLTLFKDKENENSYPF